MPGPYDAALRDVYSPRPEDIAALLFPLLGLPPPTGPVRALDADLSSVSPAGDMLLDAGEPLPLVQVDFVSSNDNAQPRAQMIYAAIAHRRHGRPVVPVLVLLRREADAARLDGRYRPLPDGLPTAGTVFEYVGVRVWELDPERLLSGPAGLAILAPLTDRAQGDLPRVVERAAERIVAEGADRAQTLWSATTVLMGLLFPDDFVDQLSRRVMDLSDSSVYKALVRKGEERGMELGMERGMERGIVEGARRVVLRTGTRKFGAVPTPVEERLNAMATVDELERLSDRLDAISGWNELFPAP